MSPVLSASNGMSILPNPPCLRGVLTLQIIKNMLISILSIFTWKLSTRDMILNLPCQMRKVGVSWSRNNFTINLPEFIYSVRKCDDFRRTKESAIKQKHRNILKIDTIKNWYINIQLNDVYICIYIKLSNFHLQIKWIKKRTPGTFPCNHPSWSL